jgi:hypothetical protein
MGGRVVNDTSCTVLSAYNRGSSLQTAAVGGCSFVDFLLKPSPSTFQPFVGVSIRIPPIISVLTFSYYGVNVSAFTFTYSNVCDHVVNAADGIPVITTPTTCSILNATSAKNVTQLLLTPAAAGLPDAAFLNIVFVGVPAQATIYMGGIYYNIPDGFVVTLGPCPILPILPPANCSCTTCDVR